MLSLECFNMQLCLIRHNKGLLLTACLIIFSAVRAETSLGAILLPASQRMVAIVDSGSFGSSDMLYEIDTLTGRANPIRVLPFNDLQSLATSSDGTIYSWSFDSGLITIDPINGGTSTIGRMSNRNRPPLQSIAFSPNGELFGISHERSAPTEELSDFLYRIDLDTGDATLVSSNLMVQPESGTIRGLEFLEQQLVGVTWATRGAISPLLSIDQATGSSSQIGLTGQSRLNSLAIDSAGRLYTSNNSQRTPQPINTLVALDPDSGSTIAELILSFSPNRRFTDIRGLTIYTIPEPAAFSLVVSSLLVVFHRSFWREIRCNNQAVPSEYAILTQDERAGA